MIKQEDLPVLKHLLDLIKDPKNNHGITLENLPDYVKENYPDRNKSLHGISLEFERLCDFFTENNIATTKEMGYGVLLISNTNTKDADIEDIFIRLNITQKRQENKDKKEDIEYKMSNLKYYSTWILLVCTIISTIIAIKSCNENKTNRESLKQLELKLQEKESELSKCRTLILDHKNQDSSFQSSSDKETLKGKRN